jgi:Fuc2NAc and GlcNAc transferase
VIALLILATGLCSALGCGLCLLLARRLRMVDVPNQRSAHTEATPHGGGVGIYAGLVCGWALAGLLLSPWPGLYTGGLVLAGPLVLLGVLDDRFGLPVGVRLASYALVCATAAAFVLLDASPGWIVGLGALYALWLVNLYNFMDGIDGIAAVEALFAALAAAGLGWLGGADGHYVLFCLLLAAACAGFLPWNWAPARLFMGDAGSVAIGFLLAALSLLGEANGALSLSVWLILLAVFIGDSTATLLLRLVRGERVTEAHSQHLYQRLARHWRSHRRVVLVMAAYNLFWLLPLALVAQSLPGAAAAALVAAYLPVLAAVWKAGKLP